MEMPKYFYFRVKGINKGTSVEVEDASDVDVVEVVRCKDCKHNSLNRIIGNTYCDLGIGLCQLYDYCSKGERGDAQ